MYDFIISFFGIVSIDIASYDQKNILIFGILLKKYSL